MKKTCSALHTVSADHAAKLNKAREEAEVARVRAARQGQQTPRSLCATFPGLEEVMDSIITGKFIDLGVVDGDALLDPEGNPTEDEDLGDCNPDYMKIVADGRTAWKALSIVNEEMYLITNAVWSSRDKKGALSIPGFNDGSPDAPHQGKRFTVTEAGALAAMVFGTREDRNSGLFFRNYIVREIVRAHEAYLKSPEARKVAEEAKARRARQEAARAKAMAAQQEADNYRQFKASVPAVGKAVIPSDAGLKVASDGTLRKSGKFVGKDKPLV